MELSDDHSLLLGTGRILWKKSVHGSVIKGMSERIWNGCQHSFEDDLQWIWGAAEGDAREGRNCRQMCYQNTESRCCMFLKALFCHYDSYLESLDVTNIGCV